MTKAGTIRFYENVDWELIEKTTHPDVKKFLRLVHSYLKENIKGNVLVLEVGCGTGDFVKEISNQVEKIMGIDVSPVLIKRAKENLRGLRNIDLITADIDDAKIPKNHFDFVISMWTLPNIDDPVKFLKKMKRVLKDDGTIFVDTYSEKATKIRIKMYEEYGLKIDNVDRNNIKIKEGLTEKIYTKKELKAIFEKAGLGADILEIHPLGYLCRARKKVIHS